MNENFQIFQYNGSPVTFQNGDSVMVNATEMAKPFGKVPKDFLINKQSQELIDRLSVIRGIPPLGLVSVNKGGTNPGTWMHEDVALVFAQWLSPDFYIWCNDRIKELLKTGATTIESHMDETDAEFMARALMVAKKTLDERQQKIMWLSDENKRLNEFNDQLLPKAQYANDVLQATETMTFTQLEADFGYRNVHLLMADLKKYGVMWRQGDMWLPTSGYRSQGLFATRTHRFFHNDGTPGASVLTVVTQRGRYHIQQVLKEKREKELKKQQKQQNVEHNEGRN